MESIVARMIRHLEKTAELLPYNEDVATFLRVDEKKRLILSRCVLQAVRTSVCYEKVLDQAGKNHTLVFAHSRKETAKTAKFLRDMAVEKEAITYLVKPDAAI